MNAGRVGASGTLAPQTGGVIEIRREMPAAHVGSPSDAARMTFCKSDVPE
jgi:hypothetical protein